MYIDQLKPNVVVRGPLFPEPVQVIVTVPMGNAVKLVGKGLTTGQVHEPILTTKQLAKLEASPEPSSPRWGSPPARSALRTSPRTSRMPEAVISDTSPLQYLHQLGQLHLLPHCYHQVIVPPTVERGLAGGRSLALVASSV